MTRAAADLRLSRIDTLWTVVCQAKDPDDAVRAAQRCMLERYSGAVRRYLLGATRDEDAADELAQEFALRFLRGGLRGAAPGRGRFRDYVKGVLIHLVANYHDGARKKLVRFGVRHPEPADDSPADQEQAFLTGWRDELLARAWAALGAQERATGQPFHTVLRYRAEHPDASSEGMAEALQATLARPLTAAGVRQTLHRARDRFADLLLDEIAAGLRNPTAADLEEELIDLGLLEYCRPALLRRLGPA
jgi:DNA-directed RNA polymerase specialized sigma24 family protein